MDRPNDCLSRCDCCYAVTPHDRLHQTTLLPSTGALTYLCGRCYETMHRVETSTRRPVGMVELRDRAILGVR